MAEVFNLRGLRWMKGWSDLIGIKQSGLFSKGREGAWAFLFGGGGIFIDISLEREREILSQPSNLWKSV